MCIVRSGGEGMSLAQGHRSAPGAQPLVLSLLKRNKSSFFLASPGCAYQQLPGLPGQMDARPWSDRPQGASPLPAPKSSHPIQGLMPSPLDGASFLFRALSPPSFFLVALTGRPSTFIS